MTDQDEFNRLFPFVREYQNLATKHNINDIFQDNGGKYLQILITLNLTTDGSREGNDATDAYGNEYEIKTVNLQLTNQFSTHHHLNPTILQKYRQVDWFFVTFNGIEMQSIYRLNPRQLAPYFDRWESKWHENRKDINNPKIPLSYVASNGLLVWTRGKF